MTRLRRSCYTNEFRDLPTRARRPYSSARWVIDRRADILKVEPGINPKNKKFLVALKDLLTQAVQPSMTEARLAVEVNKLIATRASLFSLSIQWPF